MFRGYRSRFIVNHLRILLAVEETNEQSRHVELKINDVSYGTMSFASYLDPSLALGTGYIAVWGGCKLYVYDIDKAQLRLFLQDNAVQIDEIHDAYWIDEYFLLVCELSLVLLSMSVGKEVDRYDHYNGPKKLDSKKVKNKVLTSHAKTI